MICNGMKLRLKSLELHGYKTFANRTLFEFAGAVTAIVGPNGSGKSNIADSLRWVLGEQSYSLLRAKKTEDMIFSGSENRSRAGMAAVSITLDNEDGWLPIDFTEVAITRRAYRDGENEYLINNQRVRLRDVSELLAQSGLAQRTYTFIGQGLVDAALSLKAEERRRLFEEAAGIGLHRSRRDEALRRLDTTRRNLERVQDILAELRPRLQSLERQARRARDYEQLRTDLQVLLREWYGFHWHRAQQDLTEARQAARAQEERLEQARQEQSSLDIQLGGLRSRAQELRANLNDWHRRLAQLHAQRESLSRDLATAEERQRSLLERQRGAQSELLKLGQELGLAEAQLADALAEVQRLQAEREEAHNQAGRARQALEERLAQRASIEQALQKTRHELAESSARQGQVQALLSERKARAEQAQGALKDAQDALAQAEADRRAAQASLDAALHAEQQALATRNTLETALQEHNQRLQATEQARRETLEQHAVVQAESARLRARLDVLEQAEAALTGYASGARLLLQAAQQQRLEGVRGALSKYLEVPAELETAIAAVLNEYLDAVLLVDDPEAALELLDDQGGRGVLLPLDALQLPPAEAVSAPESFPFAMEGVFGMATDLVSAPAELRPVLELLLGRVLVVRDRQIARHVLQRDVPRQGGPACERVVTQRGEVFHITGPVHTFGASGRAEEQTLLGRARQHRELGLSLERAQEQSQALEGRLVQENDVLQALQVEAGRLAQASQASRQEWEQCRATTNQARLALEQAQRQEQWQLGQIQRLGDEISRSQQEIAQLAAELARLEDRLIAAQQQQRQQTSDLDALEMEDFQVQLAHWNTLVAVIDQALTDAQARQGERSQALARLQKSQAATQAQLADMEASLQTLEGERAALRNGETEIGGNIQATQAQIEPAETDLVALEEEQIRLEKAEASARQALSTAEHFFAQTRIALDRRQEALQSLRRRVEEDFGLVAFEYTEQVSGPTPLPLDGMVEQLPIVRKLPPDLEESVRRLRVQLRRVGAINPEAQAEYQEVRQRYEFMLEQVDDLQQAEKDVRQVISELDDLMHREFRNTFQAVAGEFRNIFTRLFDGGSARLLLTDPDDLTATGIDIEAQLPGRRTQGLSLLSGGERSLTATALVFALLKVSPTPFCVLDEVDAMLDEVNVGRFRELLRELSQNTQFVIITHNRNTVQVADIIYGVTMGRDSVSQVLSLKLDEVSQLIEE